jgi:hypothetical protein
MTQSKTQTDGGLKLGDRVRLVPDTLVWRAETSLQGKIGEVTECRADGRVTVRFDNGRLLIGRDVGAFERVTQPGAKATGR